MSDLSIGVSQDEATAELNAVLASSAFARSPRLGSLLSYLCNKYMAGEADQIKEYKIGVDVLQRPATFDPTTDAAARVEVHRLRRRLQQYYETEGVSRRLRLMIPVGHYVPAFVPNDGMEVRPTQEPAQGNRGLGTVESLHADPPETASTAPFAVVSEAPQRNDVNSLGPARRWWFWAAAVVLLLAGGVLLLVQFSLRSGAKNAGTAEAAATVLKMPTVGGSLAAPPGSPLRLACGHSVPYTDRGGETWSEDRYFEGGSAFETPRQFFARAFDPRVFRSGRSGDFTYRIPLAPGIYELHLGFVETTFGPGLPAGGGEYSRTFDVKANERMLLEEFDIYSDANGANIADVRAFKDISPGADGLLRLEFHSRRGAALVNSIEVLPARPHRLNPIRMVAQENFLTLQNGAVWHPDQYVIGGVLAAHSVRVTGAEDPDLFSRERYGHFEYALPIDSGAYGLSLYFAEEYFGPDNPGGGGTGSRVFNVFCNGAELLRGVDIFKEAGMNRALVKTFHGIAPNAQGKIVVSFVPSRNYASLYAIEVVDESK